MTDSQEYYEDTGSPDYEQLTEFLDHGPCLPYLGKNGTLEMIV